MARAKKVKKAKVAAVAEKSAAAKPLNKKPEPAKVKPVVKAEKCYIAVRHTCTSGAVVKPGTRVTADDFPGGQETLESHVRAGDVEVVNG